MPDIIASYWTFAGDRFPGCGDEASPYSFKERYELAGKLGYSGADIVLDDLIRARDTIGYAELRRILEGNGLVDTEVQILTDWFADGPRRAESDRQRALLLEAGEAIGAHHLKISGDFQTKELNIDRMAESLAALNAEADLRGIPLGIEIMPFTNLATVKEGRAVVEAAGIKKGGLLLDIWHMEREGVPHADIAALPGDMIVSIEINDAAAEIQGDIWNDTLNARLLPGQGSFDIDGFLKAVYSTGFNGPIGIEIISEAQRKKPLEPAARDAIEAARPFISRINRKG
ncbi:sugar phosphate isomerase/epimerase [Rhizobium leguminosarum]|uniref:sugar phosphate isomerase/epimerase family protein n=1 Tax=Rhizobium leguminosarum TaxID=384 RepID=UPI001C90FE87|nr:sugar phosphate isomerase/epimerase family protein [Rhizobium leguminosarum]MBY2924309.1 sugar phosphate isomerase/epimerase [Rhizobium leguminosarum]